MKNRKSKKILKTARPNKLFCSVCLPSYLTNGLILGAFLAFLFFAAFTVSMAYGDENAVNSTTLDTPAKNPQIETLTHNGALNRIIDLNGVVGIDGSLRVLESSFLKVVNVVSISTPVAPVSGHAIIWLNSSDGDLKILFDNGVSKTLATN